MDHSKCPKHWTALHFNLQLLMLKAHHGWTDTSFNDLLRILGDTYPEGNKVPANTYQAKKLIQPVAMKLKSSMHVLTTVFYIGASMRICRAIRKMTRKKEVATGQVLPPKSGAMYNNRPILPDYARVEVTWTHDDFTEDGFRYIRGILGYIVLWNKEDIVLDMLTPRSQPSEPPTSPPGGGDDADANGNDNAGGPDNSRPRSPRPNMSNP
jgi:hypothetical protein